MAEVSTSAFRLRARHQDAPAGIYYRKSEHPSPAELSTVVRMLAEEARRDGFGVVVVLTVTREEGQQ